MRFRLFTRRFRLAAGVLGALLTVIVAPSTGAQAAGGPVACLTPTIFVAQGAPTQLEALRYGAGSATFESIGSPYSPGYNAIGFHPSDSYIYGVNFNEHLIRIDDGGAVTDLGTTALPDGINVGTFDDAGTFYAMNSEDDTLYEVDLVTRALTPIALTEVPSSADLTPVGGFLWGQRFGTSQLVRVNPATGQVSVFTQSAVPASVGAGAAWTFGNGNLGLSDNNSGTVYQVHIEDPDGASPTFSLVSTASGPQSGNNDGTSCAGQPVDLRITKSATDPVLPGQTITWTLTVHNDGSGISSGYTVTDDVPAGVTDVQSGTGGCSVFGNTVTCVHGAQQPGDDATFTFTGTAPSSAGSVVNTATVTGNEADPVTANNSASSTTHVGALAGLCRGTPLSFLGLRPGTANNAEQPCLSEDQTVASVPLPGLTATALNGHTVAGVGSNSASADIATVALTVPGLSLGATAVHSEARSAVGTSCSDIAVSGSSRLATLVINGTPRAVGDQPLTIPLLIGAVYVNQRVVQGSTITQRALFVDLPGTALDLVLAESRAGIACAA
jgi:uncharacterized repeat protein (TIGR01451 family)